MTRMRPVVGSLAPPVHGVVIHADGGELTADEAAAFAGAISAREALAGIVELTRHKSDPALVLEWIRDRAERGLGILP